MSNQCRQNHWCLLIAPWFDDEDPFQEDDDYYRVDIQEPGILKLVVTSVPSDVFLWGRFYNPDLTEIREETSRLFLKKKIVEAENHYMLEIDLDKMTKVELDVDKVFTTIYYSTK